MPMNNAERAEYAKQGLIQYCFEKEGAAGYDNPIDEAADLICDLLHFIRAEGGDPVKKLAMAVTNFEAEEEEESA